MTAFRSDQVDDYHGELVADPYRWLEDTYATETASWIEEQNSLTEAYLCKIPAREEIRQRLVELWDFPRLGVPFSRAGRWFQWRNSGLQDQSVLYVGESLDDEGEVLLDPNELSADGTVAVPHAVVSEDGELVCYATAAAGSDWMTWRLREVASKKDLDDVIEWSKFGVASFAPDASGFYYSSLERPEGGSEFLEKSEPPKIAFHRVGTEQSRDELVFEVTEDPEWSPHAKLSDDGRYLVITIAHGTAAENQLRVIDLADPSAGALSLVGDFADKAVYVTNVGETFYLLTTAGAARQRIVAVELGDARREAWREVVAEDEATLLGAANCGQMLVCHYLAHSCSRLRVFSLEGAFSHEVELPPVCSLAAEFEDAGVEGSPESEQFCYGVTSFTDPGSIYCHDLATKTSRLVSPSTVKIDASELVSEQVFVTADDGARIPLFITRRRDLEKTGEAPALLYGYGGFDIPISPSFVVARAVFVERGGVLAVACLRGGGEYGRAWHEAGMLANKERVFDDFRDCAKWLSSSGWTRAGRIAINGASNGGLLVGASMLRYPECFGAAVPEVGVLDMLRFHKFTIGWAWKSDYGDPDDPEQYRWLRAYSPLHNIEEMKSYPPTLVVTGDHDDRVVPGHSFKFAASLQHAQRETAPEERSPVLVRVEPSTGHGHGMPTSKAIAKATDVLSFIEAAVGS